MQRDIRFVACVRALALIALTALASLANAGCGSCAGDDYGTKERLQKESPVVPTVSSPKHVRAPMLQNIMGDGGGAEAGVPPPP